MSTDRNFPPAIRKLIGLVDQFGGHFDPKLRKAIEVEFDVIAKAEGLDIGTGPDVYKMIVKAIRVDVDPTTDPEVTSAMQRRQFSGMGFHENIVNAARADLFALVANRIDDVVTTLKPEFQKQAERLTAAHEIMSSRGIHSLEQSAVIASAGIEVARANVEAREATGALRTILNAISGVLLSLSMSPTNTPTGSTLWIADTGTSTRDEIRLAAHDMAGRMDPWQALEAGYTLSLATPTELEQRLAKLDELDDQQTARAEADRRQYTQAHGF